MRRILVYVSLSLLLLAPRAFAQLASQTALVGTVTDSSGAVLPGAQVVAVNVGTKDTYEATTTAEGTYNIQFVRSGNYEITVTLSGFQTYKATGVQVGDNQVVRTNAVLPAGGVVETVTVDARPPVLNTDTPVVNETIGTRAIKDLPITGRNVWNLAATTPGVLGGVNSDIGLSFRGAGQREIQNSLSLDGINATANLLASTSMKPIADAVTEMNIQTGSASAEYGSYLGVSINVVTKAGTNDFHGAVSEYYQGNQFDSHGYFDAPGTPINPRKRNQFAFEGDGPVMFPGYDGRNKTFFMGAYEGLRSNTSTTSFATVPTALMRAGNFSEVAAIHNPFTGQAFAGNIIPGSLISPIATSLLNYYPVPNLPGTSSNLRATRTAVSNGDQVLVRGDQNVSNAIRMYFRYNYYKTYDSAVEAVPTTSVTQPRVNKNYLFAYDHTLTPTIYNDFRVGYHQLNFDTLNYYSVNNLTSAGTDLGIPGFNSDTADSNPGVPTININNGFTSLGASGTNWNQFDKTFQLSDVLSWNKSAHTIRMGFDLRRLETGRRAANDPRGAFTFTGQMTGYSVADFMMGLPRTVVNNTTQLWGDVGQWRNGFFINDVWQAANKLTFSLGLRYEMNTPAKTFSGQASMLDATETHIIPTTFPSPGFEFTEPNKKDFAPRLGATYRLNDKTVWRAGYGIYYNPNQMNSYTFLTNNPPITQIATFTSDPTNPTLSFTSPTGSFTPSTRPDVISPTRVLPNARKFQWNTDIQRELAAGMALDIEYLGSHTEHLDRSFFDNTPVPGPGNVDDRRPTTLFRSRRIISNDLIANYDALMIILRKRMSNGLQLDASYTWSKTLDENTCSNCGGQTMDNYDPMRDYGPAAWDVPHRFVASYIYDVPFLKTSPNAFLRYVVANWQVAGITTIQSGTPVNVTIGSDVANIGITGQQRANLVGSVPSLNCSTDPATKKQINCFDPSAFAMPAQYTFGNAGRNILRGPHYTRTDLSFAKNVPIVGNAKLELHLDVFNIFNNVNFANPNSTFGSASFGVISGLAAGEASRQMQLGARFIF